MTYLEMLESKLHFITNFTINKRKKYQVGNDSLVTLLIVLGNPPRILSDVIK